MAINEWRQTRRGRLVSGLVELALCYLIGSRALFTGSWWEYGLTVLLLVDGIQNLVKAIKKK